jgi:hypothetical protein
VFVDETSIDFLPKWNRAPGLMFLGTMLAPGLMFVDTILVEPLDMSILGTLLLGGGGGKY